MKRSIVTIALTLIVVPFFANAGAILRSGETISIDTSQTLQGDFYGLAQSISISGVAEHDLYLAGGNITINAPVRADVTAIAGSVSIHDEIGDDVRLLAGKVTISKRVKGDVVVYAGSLHILPTAHIEGDVIFAGEKLTIEGDVDGGIHGFSQTIRINSIIGGEIEYKATEQFALGDNAEVRGSITYQSDNELARSTNAIVNGDIRKSDTIHNQTSDPLGSLLIVMLTTVFAGLTFFFVGKRHVGAIVSSSISSLGQNGLIGIALLLFLPFASFVFMISVVGVFIGLALLFSYFLMLTASLVLTGILFGHLAFKFFSKNTNISLTMVLVGSLIFSALLFVPVVGPLAILGSTLVILGQLGRQIVQKFRT